LRYLKLTLQRVEDTERAFTALVNYVFPAQVELLFAFTHRLSAGPDAGWSVYDAGAEFERQGATLPRPDGAVSPWRFTLVNHDYRSVRAVALCVLIIVRLAVVAAVVQ
jgi:Myotubularin-like phosphatase domain